MENCYHIYKKNTVPNKGFAKLLKIINKMLMKNNELSVNYSIQSKTGFVCLLRLDMQKIHACSNYCILYHIYDVTILFINFLD